MRPIAVDVSVSHDPPQPCFEVRSWLKCSQGGICLENCFLHQILRIRSIGGHSRRLPIERLKKRDDGAFELCLRRAVWHRCTPGANATHATFLPSRKVLPRSEAGNQRMPESGSSRPQKAGAAEGCCPDRLPNLSRNARTICARVWMQQCRSSHRLLSAAIHARLIAA